MKKINLIIVISLLIMPFVLAQTTLPVCTKCPDLNKDGIINNQDGVLLYSCSSTGTCPESYDLNSDGIISIISDTDCLASQLNKNAGETGLCPQYPYIIYELTCENADFNCDGKITVDDAEVVGDIWQSGIILNKDYVTKKYNQCKFLGKYLDYLLVNGIYEISLSESTRVAAEIYKLQNTCEYDVTEKPDLIVKNLKVTQEKDPIYGLATWVDYDIENIGKGPVNEKFLITVFIDGVPKGNMWYWRGLADDRNGATDSDPSLPVLKPQEMIHRGHRFFGFYPATYKDGELHKVSVKVDSFVPAGKYVSDYSLKDNVVDETNEYNNEMSVKFAFGSSSPIPPVPLPYPIPKPYPENILYRNSYWQCYDGTESYEGSESSCKSSEIWNRYANDFCKEKCNYETGKCGVNTFKVYNECGGSIEKPLCGNGICEDGEGKICQVGSYEGRIDNNPCYTRCPQDCKQPSDDNSCFGRCISHGRLDCIAVYGTESEGQCNTEQDIKNYCSQVCEKEDACNQLVRECRFSQSPEACNKYKEKCSTGIIIDEDEKQCANLLYSCNLGDVNS